MYVTSLKAIPNSCGNQINLAWVNPSTEDFPGFKGVKIVRRVRRFPKITPPEFMNGAGLVFNILTDFQQDLNDKIISNELRQFFENNARPLLGHVVLAIEQVETKWLIIDERNVYSIQKQMDRLDVIHLGYFEYDGELAAFTSTDHYHDNGLRSEVIYYYTFFTFYIEGENSGACRLDHQCNRNSRISAMATAKYGSAEALYRLLPAIYMRYDTARAKPASVSPADESKGELQRFLDIFGEQFDLIRSYGAGVRQFFDLDRCDGALLQLLAQWIGWQTNLTLDLNSQRNEIRRAPEVYKTVGIAANLRALVNRLTNWDSQIKEFVHNVFLTNDPDHLTIWSQRLGNGNWSCAELVTLDFAYDGAPCSLVDSDGRIWLFYHAKQDQEWDIWYKICDQGKWAPACKVTWGQQINKYPSAVQMSCGNIWLFYSAYEYNCWNIRSKIMAVGRNASAAQLVSKKSEPFHLEEGKTLTIKIDGGEKDYTVTFHSSDYVNIAEASCAEIIYVVNRDIPELTAINVCGRICLRSKIAGQGSSFFIELESSTAASILGFDETFQAHGQDSAQAQLVSGRQEPFALADESILIIQINGKKESSITFLAGDFADINNATCAEIIAVLNRDVPNITVVSENGQLVLKSNSVGEDSSLIIDVDASTAASSLGFGQSLPTVEQSELEPSVFQDDNGHIWLFYSSRRQNRWDVWYNMYNGEGWGTAIPLPLTQGVEADRKPAAIYAEIENPDRKIWVFWDKKIIPELFDVSLDYMTELNDRVISDALKQEFEEHGIFFSDDAKVLIEIIDLKWRIIDRQNEYAIKNEVVLKVYGMEQWNIYYCTKENTNFDEPTWNLGEPEPLISIPANRNYDNREPAVKVDGQGNILVFWSSNGAGSWNIWCKKFNKTQNNWSDDMPATLSFYTHKAPTIISDDNGDIRLFYRSNEAVTYWSDIYPGTKTLDSRYAGSTTIDVRNSATIGKRRNFEDILHYTYDTGKTNENWYARDAVGIYLTPDSEDQKLVMQNQELVRGILNRFLPIQLRAVFIINPAIYNELIYTYDFGNQIDQRIIGEMAFDQLLTEVYSGLDENYRDRIPEWIWLRSWSQDYKNHRTVRVNGEPQFIEFRTWHIGIDN